MAGGQGGNGAGGTGGGAPGQDDLTPNGTGGSGGPGTQAGAGGGGGGSGTNGGAGGAGAGGAAGGAATPSPGGARVSPGTPGTSAAAGSNGGGGGGGGAPTTIGNFTQSGSFLGRDYSGFVGTGGIGGAGDGSGSGGGGGGGGTLFRFAGGNFYSTQNGTIVTGGAGGQGGAAGGGVGSFGGNGGDGGPAVFIASGSSILGLGSGFTIGDGGKVIGGAGGAGGSGGLHGTAGLQGSGGAGVIAADTTLSVNAGGTLAGGAGSTPGYAAIFMSGKNTLNLGGTITGKIAIQAGTLQINAATGGSTLANPITGSGGIIQDSANTLTLTGANTYAGPTTIRQGTLALAGTSSIANSSGVAVANTGTLDISGTSAGASVATLSGSGQTTLGAQTLTITNGSSSYDGAITGTGRVAVSGGTQTLTGASSYSGGTTLGANGSTTSSTLQLGGPSAAGTGAITFASMSGTATARLGLSVAAQPVNGGTFSNTIANFGTGSEISLAGLTNSSVSYNSATSSITVTGTRAGGEQVSERFVLSAPRAENFAATVDDQGNTIIRAAPPAPTPKPPAPCYVTGTRIRVLRGRTIQDVPVERLRVGDLAMTAAGRPRPIRWIGTQHYPGLTAPEADRPVRIRAGAFHDGVPARDLLVSPDHAVWLDGLFVAAGHLVNGTSVTRGEAVADLTYWHLELDSHDLLMAENTPAESFLPAPGIRRLFDGHESDAAATAPLPYAHRAELGPELAALRRRLIRRAGASSDPARPAAVRAWLDRCALRADGALHVAGWAQDAARPGAKLCLDIVIDGRIVAMTVAAEYRADIAAAGVGDGRHGFDLGVDAPLAHGVAHVVEVRNAADAAVICAMAADPSGAWRPLLAA